MDASGRTCAVLGMTTWRHALLVQQKMKMQNMYCSAARAYMLSSYLGWAAVSSFASTIIKQLQIEERARHTG
ncbi:hypothetical protein TKK_0008037 [Trichogramma kaykai]